MLTEWQRLEQVVKWAGLSVNSFGREIGLSRSETLYQIKRGNNGISRDLAETICRRYPQISKGWIMAGEGQMLLDGLILKISRVPFFDSDVEECVLRLGELEPAGEIMLPMFDGCDFAAVYYGRAMSGDVESGSIVVLKKSELDGVLPGEIYLVVSERFVVLRRVRQASDDAMLCLETSASQGCESFEIPRESVGSIYRLVGVVNSRKF
jgi:hypothetical protein